MSEYIERCAAAGLAVFLEAFPNTLTPSDARYIAKQMTRAALEAGRLSECPEVVEATVRVTGINSAWIRQVLHAAEDVALI